MKIVHANILEYFKETVLKLTALIGISYVTSITKQIIFSAV